MTGILLINKPKGITSAAALNQVKRQLGRIKIGHTGTLDPQATGLLVCLLENATPLAHNFAHTRKRYEGEIVLGIETSTDDTEGEIIGRSDVVPSVDAIQQAAQTFEGEIEQVPPRVSAVKIDGKRAYDRARKGEDFEIKSRKVTVYSFEILEIKDNRIKFEIECSSGTYIRSIARDLGKMLGCCGCLGALCRTGVGPFHVRDAVIPEAVTLDWVRPWWELFPEATICAVSSHLESSARRGLRHPLERELDAQLQHTSTFALLKNRESERFFGYASRSQEGWCVEKCL